MQLLFLFKVIPLHIILAGKVNSMKEQSMGNYRVCPQLKRIASAQLQSAVSMQEMGPQFITLPYFSGKKEVLFLLATF